MKQKKQISIQYDPWEAYIDMKEYSQLQLTSVEFTTTTLCNMRCEHCAVGYTLQLKDPTPLPLSLLLKRLDEVENLRCISITGGEPILSSTSVKEYVLPLLKYAHERGVYTQVNSNLTLPLSKYEQIAPYIDVLHISHNWGTVTDFVEGGFAKMGKKPSFQQREAYFERMIANSRALSAGGVFVSAETMLNERTIPHMKAIHQQIVHEMGCQRHEIHPMYNSDYASTLPTTTKVEIREAIHHLLDVRNQDVWMLFGTLPFYWCSEDKEDIRLLQRIQESHYVTVRNDPDGRSRLNVNIFDGNIIVTDFGDTPIIHNIQQTTLLQAYEQWQQTTTAKSLSCHCPAVQCLGPNLLVKNTYYSDTNFTKKSGSVLSPFSSQK